MDMDFSQFSALRPFVALWAAKLELAREHKTEKFGKDAKQATDYYIGPHNFVYSKSGASNSIGFAYSESEDDPFRAPLFQMTFNKVAELVQLFGPLLYHRNPVRVVRPRKDWRPPDLLLEAQQPSANGQPQQPAQQQGPLLQQMSQLGQSDQVKQTLDRNDALHQTTASLIEAYLNYTPNELNLKEEMRLSIDEALVKGRGCLWTELYEPPGTQYRMIGSFFDTVDNLQVDPDTTRLMDAKWIARRCRRPAWEIERERGLPLGSLKAKSTAESTEVKASANSFEETDTLRKQGKSADLLIYYRIWSKMGMGHRLKDSTHDSRLGEVSELSEIFGDYIYLEILPGGSFPLNVPPDLAEKYFGDNGREMLQAAVGAEQMLQMSQQQGMPVDPQVQELAGELATLRQALSWPIAFWADDEWPVTPIEFHPRFDCSWPMSHLRPAMGEQNFLDWAYSFLAGHIRNACRTFIAIKKSASEDVKTAITQGRDLSVIELEALNEPIGNLVQFLQHPQVNKDIFTIIQAIEHNFEKRTGLSEMMYGQTATQSRSAADAQTKAGALQIRPDDMAERVEYAATILARKEGIAARLLITGQDVAPILGDFAAQFWDQNVSNQDMYRVCREFDFRIESSSARKPNKDRDVANTQEGLQVILPLLSQWAQTAPENIKALNAFLKSWAKARDYEVGDFEIQAPPPPPPPEQAPQEQPPEQAQTTPGQQMQGQPPPAPQMPEMNYQTTM